ncbi:transcription factor MYB27-like isoform X2 [Cucurbita pepo subsp. pepo]|uniref:transcription factor MYB27-like isoform X2 n=1 Tax=Cucurbita pepo subsp. pepo TaxID=3664 RepID=UPI000C9D838E|nr:transcription factor MYB27-like isoform X2 [Cucurbita pepo subsp. pepo]
MATHSALQAVQRRGPWLQEEDRRLTMFVTRMGERKWDSIAKASGLERSGKSCRFRWLNYLRPNLKRDRINSKEEEIIMKLHKKWGNKWSRIARWLPGRTDNEIKNYWRSHLRKKFPIQLEDCKVKHGKQDKLSLRHDQNERDVPLYNHFELSNLEITNSPYEIRLSNWISNQLINEKQEVNHHEECNNLEFCFYSPNMNYAHRDDQTDHFWDSFTLWDIE